MNVVRAALPFFYVRNWRYYQGAKVFSYIIGSLAPTIAYVYICDPTFRWIDFALLWLLFWTGYEIGYLFNDCRSVDQEELPTYRAPSDVRKHFVGIVLFRCLLFSAGMAVAATQTEIPIQRLIAITLIIGVTFALHNSFADYRRRFVTLVLLSILKPIFVIYSLGLDPAPYILLLLPHLPLKYIDYLYSKGMAKVNLSEDLRLRWFLFTAWFGPVALVVPQLLWVYLLIYAGYTKHFYWEKLTATQWGARFAERLPLHAMFGRVSE